MERLYLVRLYRQKRWLFVLVALFILGQSFFHFKGVETVPFFLYGMYSEPMEQSMPRYRLVIMEEGQPLDLTELSGLNKDVVYHATYCYLFHEAWEWEDPIKDVAAQRFGGLVDDDMLMVVLDRLANDVTDREPFRQWLRRYLENSYGRKLGELEVELWAASEEFAPDHIFLFAV